MSDAILAIDQGTTSSRAIVFSPKGEILATAQQEFEQLYPGEGMVEHDPQAIWSSVLATAQAAYREAVSAGHKILGIGITNQRETIIVWDRKTGKPIHNAIVWQDRRTAQFCRALSEAGHEALVQDRAGLLLDPYFSASKLNWILSNVDGARARAEAGELAAGTVDSWLLWNLTGGEVHATDATNACRTSLFGLDAQDWDQDLLKLFDVPRGVLPDVKDSADDFGMTQAEHFGEALPILSVVGDQQGATVGQACFEPGEMKSTYGTGCFVLVNTGDEIKKSENRLLTTVAYRVGGKPTFAMEGSIFIAGAAVQWLRDEMRLLKNAAETAERAARAQADADVVMVPAFAGMGAPHWSPDARAAVFGMTRATGPDEMARAALEGVVYQTQDLIEAMKNDGLDCQAISVDGGMAANDWFAQRLSDILSLPIDRPKVLETTALGAAYLAFLQAGVFSSLNDVRQNAERDRRFEPQMPQEERARRLKRWKACVQAVLSVAEAG
ncbi:glycerol kinase GlpK [Parvularcula sp. ZS-1/3]|uniref:glycerol kinase n=1 Tax=Parvularcula mediterranea TaxID=2732508 RepID=A0A7Y3RIK3_9PROT|nr:glycerol kinase GlpK [Parvularcula mediterranea]NNU14749.1 glycerol kinase GlpK [Parvularcula mediterranea]